MKMNVIPTNAIERKAAADRMNKMKNKLALGAMSAACSAMVVANAAITAYADGDNMINGENSNSNITSTSTMTDMVGIVFWIVRVIVLLIGGVAGIPKIVQGQADENPRDRNNGLATIGIAGAAFAATFGIENII